MADEQSEHLQTDEDVEAILRLAVHSPSRDSRELRERLARSAAELGLTPDQLAHAEEAYAAQKQAEAEAVRQEHERRRAKLKRLKGLVGHLVPYVTVNAMLHLLNFKTGFDSYWAIWPLLGWGIGVATHTMHVLFNLDQEDEDEEEEDEGRRRRVKRKILDHVLEEVESELRSDREKRTKG